MQLSREQVNVLIKNGQQSGLTGKEVLDGLIERGYEPEGIDINQAKQSILSEKQQLDRGFDTKTDIQQTGQGIKEAVQKRLGNIDTIREAQKSGEQSGVRSVFQTAGQVAGGISDVIGETVVGAGKVLLPQQAEEKVASTVKTGIERGMARGQEIPRETLLSKYEELKQTNPKAARDVEALLGFGSLALDVGTAGVGGEAAKTGVKAGKKAIQETIQTTTEASGKFASDLVGKTIPESSDIMNRVARLKPTDANKFKNIAGKTQGEYLAETGNFGTPDEIIKKEAEKFTQSKLDVDNTLASLPGKYNDGSIQDALNGLIEKAKLESGENIKAPYLDRAIELQNKSKTEGLTMGDINEVKRLYEKNVRLGYNKLTDSTKVNQATNIDTALRNFQFSKAKELGFENLDQLNKQTQISKFIIDKLGDQIVGQNGLNNVSLTDWIMLSGGDPTAVGGFLTKKFFGSKAIQSKIAKMLNKTEIKGQIKPKVKSSVERSLRGGFPKGVPLQLEAGGTTRTSFPSGKTIPVAPKGLNVEITGKRGVIPTRAKQK